VGGGELDGMSTRLDYRPPPRHPHRGTSRVVKVIGVLGRIFVLAGVMLLFFTAYLLWGTGVYTHHQQGTAKKSLQSNPLVNAAQVTAGHIPPAKPASPLPLGSPLFTIKIPKIALETAVVEGVGREQLKKGPGHFPSCSQVPAGEDTDCVQQTVYPGEHGNVAISGHRTTYGAPFFNLQQLEQGDIIDIISGPARYRYRVRGQQVVDPTTGYNVVLDHGHDELTLTTCNPRFSASQRLIISADYIGASLVSAAGSGGGPGGTGTPKRAVAANVIALAVISVACAIAAVALSKKYKVWALYASLTIIGAAGLWVGIFPRVLALMPANY
jgi:sortase A